MTRPDVQPGHRVVLRLVHLPAIVALTVVLFAACVAPVPQQPSAPGPAPSAPAPSAEEAEARLAQLWEAGNQFETDLQITFALRTYVELLATAARYENAVESERTGELRRAALARLAALETRMNLSGHDSWYGADGSRRAGSVAAVAAMQGLLPDVLLTYESGFGLLALEGAPVTFRVAEGRAEVDPVVRTSPFGRAGTSVRNADAAQEALVISVGVEIEHEGYVHQFSSLQLDFTYVAAPGTASVVAVITADDESRLRDEAIERAVAQALQQTAPQIEFVQAPNELLRLEAQRTAAGSVMPSIIAAALDQSHAVGYLVVVHLEIHAAEQLRLGERLFDLWRTRVAASVSLFATATGSRLYALDPAVQEEGQGASAADARADGIDRATRAVVGRILDELPFSRLRFPASPAPVP